MATLRAAEVAPHKGHCGHSYRLSHRRHRPLDKAQVSEQVNERQPLDCVWLVLGTKWSARLAATDRRQLALLAEGQLLSQPAAGETDAKQTYGQVKAVNGRMALR